MEIKTVLGLTILQIEWMKRLKVLYKETYGKELEGDELGQFSSDFEVKGATDVHSCEAIFLGKKFYNDRLKFTKNGKVGYGNHTRGKGIPGRSITYDAEQKKVSVMQLYKEMFFRVGKN